MHILCSSFSTVFLCQSGGEKERNEYEIVHYILTQSTCRKLLIFLTKYMIYVHFDAATVSETVLLCVHPERHAV